jgi:hypothetical protein
VPYGLTYHEAGGPLTNFYYKDSSDLPENKRYGFRGWTTGQYAVDKGGANVRYFNLEKDKVVKALNLYPYYETEDVYNDPSNLEYFNIDEKNGTIALRREYKNSFKGKLTIPNIKGISKVNDFESIKGLTHVFFEDGGPNYTII